MQVLLKGFLLFMGVGCNIHSQKWARLEQEEQQRSVNRAIASIEEQKDFPYRLLEVPQTGKIPQVSHVIHDLYGVSFQASGKAEKSKLKEPVLKLPSKFKKPSLRETDSWDGIDLWIRPEGIDPLLTALEGGKDLRIPLLVQENPIQLGQMNIYRAAYVCRSRGDAEGNRPPSSCEQEITGLLEEGGDEKGAISVFPKWSKVALETFRNGPGSENQFVIRFIKSPSQPSQSFQHQILAIIHSIGFPIFLNEPGEAFWGVKGSEEAALRLVTQMHLRHSSFSSWIAQGEKRGYEDPGIHLLPSEGSLENERFWNIFHKDSLLSLSSVDLPLGENETLSKVIESERSSLPSFFWEHKGWYFSTELHHSHLNWKSLGTFSKKSYFFQPLPKTQTRGGGAANQHAWIFWKARSEGSQRQEVDALFPVQEAGQLRGYYYHLNQ